MKNSIYENIEQVKIRIFSRVTDLINQAHVENLGNVKSENITFMCF